MKTILFGFLFSFCSISSFAQTNVSGGIYQNTTWSLSGSPYIVNSSIVVFPGKTLTIEPGVEIQINNQNNSNIYIETRGTINCVGTDAQPIKIHALYDTLSTVAWQGFVCTSSQGGVLNADRIEISNAYFPLSYETIPTTLSYTNSKFVRCFQAVTVGTNLNLSACEFIDNEVGVYGWANFNINNCLFKENTTSLYIYASAFAMSNCSFIDNQIGASFLANAVDSIVISSCEFFNNGLAINYPNNGRVENCEFSDNGTAVQAAYDCEIKNNTFFYNILAIEATVDANIHNNQINNNAEGIIISNVTSIQDSPSIYDNEICGNTYYNVNNNTNMNYSLFSNCFCDLDSAQIEAYLIDGYDDITKGLINYQIYDSSCTLLLGNVVKFGEGAGLEEAAFEFQFENPIHEQLQLIAPFEVKEMVFQNMSGQTYYFRSSTNNLFDLSQLAPGYYFIVKLGEQRVSKALVKY
ncbi:MAG: hypothetical protein EAZ48_04055 [Flavobacteriia bacterium]|nr:MAG: hypothetical protein EAZ48_04055 [Flavobacteriia bacterium]